MPIGDASHGRFQCTLYLRRDDPDESALVRLLESSRRRQELLRRLLLDGLARLEDRDAASPKRRDASPAPTASALPVGPSSVPPTPAPMPTAPAKIADGDELSALRGLMGD
jgi:hypothetical protein